MGKNKGKGAALLRRKNTASAQERLWEREYQRIKGMGFPDVSFMPNVIHFASQSNPNMEFSPNLGGTVNYKLEPE